jgi:FkbM family methyltransferase
MSFEIVLRSIWHNPGNKGHRFVKLLRAIVWQASKRVLKRRKRLVLANGSRIWAYPDCTISSSLIYADWPEHDELMFIRSCLRQGDSIIDVGANVGHIMLLLSDLVPPLRLYGFEPAPTSFSRLLENWQLNGWQPEHLYPVALSDKDGKLFIRAARNPETTNQVHASKDSLEDIEVESRALDSLSCFEAEAPIGLLKIDVEGYEGAVFKGGAGFLRSSRPRLIMFESLRGKLDTEISRMMRLARYRVFQLDSKGKPDFTRTAAQNLFAIPEETVPLNGQQS